MTEVYKNLNDLLFNIKTRFFELGKKNVNLQMSLRLNIRMLKQNDTVWTAFLMVPFN